MQPIRVDNSDRVPVSHLHARAMRRHRQEHPQASHNDAYHATLLKAAVDHQPTLRPVREDVRVIVNGLRCDESVTLKPGG